MNDDQNFLIEEFKALRAEIELHITELRTEERYTVVAVVAVWTWLFTNHVQSRLAWSIPVMLVSSLLLRMFSIYTHIRKLGEYIKTRVEPTFYSSIQNEERGIVFGYETFISGSNYVSRTLKILAFVLLLATAMAIYLGPKYSEVTRLS